MRCSTWPRRCKAKLASSPYTLYSKPLKGKNRLMARVSNTGFHQQY